MGEFKCSCWKDYLDSVAVLQHAQRFCGGNTTQRFLSFLTESMLIIYTSANHDSILISCGSWNCSIVLISR